MSFQSPRTRSSDLASSNPTDKTKSAQHMHPPRRESAAASTADAASQRPSGLKSRAYSAPLVHRNRLDAAEHMAGIPATELPEDEEIAEDPFFQRFNFPESGPSAAREPSSSSVDGSSDTEGPLSPTFVKNRQPGPSETVPSPKSPVQSVAVGAGTIYLPSNMLTQPRTYDSVSTMQDLNIAVIGARGTGKSMFIRRALNLPQPITSAISSRKMRIDEGYYVVRFLEIGFNDIHIGELNHVKWPETVADYATPRIDGVVTIYDVTDQESLVRVPEMLSVLSKNSMPFVLVATKCDQHPAHRDVDPAVVEEKAKSFLGDIKAFQTSEATPDVDKRCLAVITRDAIAAKRPRSQASMARPRASSSAVRHVARKDEWAARKHERANSEFSLSRRRPGSSEARGHRYKSSETPGHTFLDLEESPGYDSNDSDSPASDGGQSIVSREPSDENGYTFNQLVDRLLAQPLSKNDSKFVSIFLALYRKFATPGQLLEAIFKRFDALNEDTNPRVIRIIAQLRYLTVLQQWVSYYPGDFAYPTSRRMIRRFVSSLTGNREFAVAAREMIHDLEAVTEDDDTEWACSDRQREELNKIPSFHNVLDEDSEDDEFSRAIGHLSVTDNRLSIAPSMRTTMTGASRSTATSTASSAQTLLNQVERNEKVAKMLVPNPTKPLSKIQWHQLMAESDDAIAKELTRIDWIMFSSIRPRDLVRHVSMNAEEKKKCKSLENVNRMIDHFNHVAYLVTNYILLRDKPKHRALMLEKWMRIARALRQLNNYNGLGAVMAGIHGTAVHRLVATRELVPQSTARDFMKLEILMGTQKSHFAYRLAWENSSGERIPYIPLHRRDLVSASEGNSTFVGDRRLAPAFNPHPGVSVFQSAPGNRDSKEAPPGGVQGKERINWKKFEIMGEVIIGVQRAQGTPYPPMGKNDEVKSLILDVKILKDDDELYDRSVQLEAAGAGERNRRIINWFRER
ncbi:ras GEF [Westerdykella ornata]|uniref:Ras GEF n=1 Tax=Westerdykella ornata TaxID=318751 RepID=A0A6A6JAU7_WESOR|nr:ras GEF [Westerdykella ornata]KAF2273354.1 ras GEF [Westerdykella ornata]